MKIILSTRGGGKTGHCGNRLVLGPFLPSLCVHHDDAQRLILMKEFDCKPNAPRRFNLTKYPQRAIYHHHQPNHPHTPPSPLPYAPNHRTQPPHHYNLNCDHDNLHPRLHFTPNTTSQNSAHFYKQIPPLVQINNHHHPNTPTTPPLIKNHISPCQ